MKKISRRQFVDQTGSMMALAGLPTFAGKNEDGMELRNVFIHHVYFWLKNPGSQEDLGKLLAGLKKLSAVKTIRQFHIGKPADTNREVIDRSYSLSWMLIFDSKSDQDSYQTDPIHLNFVKECSSLWTKVVVYDTVDAG